MIMEQFKNTYECPTCNRKFQFGPERYEGRFIRDWNLTLCGICSGGQDKEFPPIHEERLIEILRERGIKPLRNRSGFIVVPRAL